MLVNRDLLVVQVGNLYSASQLVDYCNKGDGLCLSAAVVWGHNFLHWILLFKMLAGLIILEPVMLDTHEKKLVYSS